MPEDTHTHVTWDSLESTRRVLEWLPVFYQLGPMGSKESCIIVGYSMDIADVRCFSGSEKVTLSLPHSNMFWFINCFPTCFEERSQVGTLLETNSKSPCPCGGLGLFSGAWKLLVSGVVYLQQKSQPDAGSGRRIALQPSGHVIAMSRRTRYSWNFHHK